MKPLAALCEPRASVFDTAKRDTVLDLTDLIEKRIEPAEFFEENYVTEGMNTLLREVFRRLEGKSEQGVFYLKQSMGGGKTHNLLTLGTPCAISGGSRQGAGRHLCGRPRARPSPSGRLHRTWSRMRRSASGVPSRIR